MNTEEGEPSCVDKSDESDKPVKKARYSSEDKQDTSNHVQCSKSHQMNHNGESSSSQKDAACSCNNAAINLLMRAADRALEYDIPVETFHVRGNEVDGTVQQNLSPEDLLDGDDEEYFLLRWQARQLAKGFVDNTINRVLEQWRSSVGASGLSVENCDGDELVEDEGILMAIQSHGLRQESDQQSSYSDNDINIDSLLDNSRINVENVENKSNSHIENCKEGDTEKIDDTDFLNAAVSVAISSKGLASCSYK